MNSAVSFVVSFAHSFALSSAVLLASCGDPAAPAKPLPATLELVSNPSATAPVGSAAGNFLVRVKDAAGNPLSGVMVNFTVSIGGGSVSPVADTSRTDGTVSAALTVGNVPGPNELTATVSGVTPVKSTSVTGVVGTPFRIAITRRWLRFPVSDSSEVISARVHDSLGNNTGALVTWTSREPGLASLTPGNGNNVTVRVVSRPGQTFVVASTAAVSDSIQVSVLDASSTPCTFAASPNTLAVGGSLEVANDGLVCIRSEDAGAEYALVSHYSTPVTALITVEVSAAGIQAVAPAIAPAPDRRPSLEGDSRAVSFETALRERERREIEGHVTGARAWFRARSLALTAGVREGNIVSANVNAFDFCGNPDLRAARVVAITGSAIILADTANPTGGFTDAEYRDFGIAMDTLVSPVDTMAFGSPTDIDGNGRVVILFTRAVNELTPRGSGSGIVLGFFYSRDLLPKVSSTGICPGSNVGEMFYIMVPDTGSVAGDQRSKAYVQRVVVATIAHEFQHLINASRRLYVTKTPSAAEEVWLNEGLSHLAEELVFYRASNLAPRQNLGASDLQNGSAARAAFETFQRGNFSRYQQYLVAPGLNSPLATEDLVATRGAAWAFLRYFADRVGTSDGDLWFRIVNSQVTGIDNLDGQLAGTGMTTLSLLRDWSVSVFADDNVPGSGPAFQEPSWNYVTAMPEVGLSFSLAPIILNDEIVSTALIRAAGSSYVRFAVPQSQEALLQVTGANGRPIPPGLRLLIVRTK